MLNMFNTRNESGISAHLCIILCLYFSRLANEINQYTFNYGTSIPFWWRTQGRHLYSIFLFALKQWDKDNNLGHFHVFTM